MNLVFKQEFLQLSKQSTVEKLNLKPLKKLGITFNYFESGDRIYFTSNDTEISSVVFERKVRRGNIDWEDTGLKISLLEVLKNLKLSSKESLLEFYLKLDLDIFEEIKEEVPLSIVLANETTEQYKNRVLNFGDRLLVYRNNYYSVFSSEDLDRIARESLKGCNKKSLKLRAELKQNILDNLKDIADTKESFTFEKIYSKKNTDYINLVFIDGTLTIYKNKVVFKDNSFDKEDFAFLRIEREYRKLFISEEIGIVSKWLYTKFQETDINFIKASLGDLLITSKNTQIVPYIYGVGGTGKSLLISAISNLLPSNIVGALSLNKVGEKFENTILFDCPINFSSEINDRNISSDNFKSFITREKVVYNNKFEKPIVTNPLAKNFAIANTVPNIKTDSGVLRRFLPVELQDEKITEFKGINLSSLEKFDELFLQDEKGLLNILIEGIQICLEYSFNLVELYDNTVNQEYRAVFTELNSLEAEFINKYIIKTENNNIGIRLGDLFNNFKDFLKQTRNNSYQTGKTRFSHKLKELSLNQFSKPIKIQGKLIKIPAYYQGLELNIIALQEDNIITKEICFDLENWKEDIDN